MTRPRVIQVMVVLAVMISVGCSGNSITAPTPIPTPTAPTMMSVTMNFFDSVSGTPVNGVSVTASGKSAPQIVNSGQTVEVLSNDLNLTIEKGGYRGPYKTAYKAGRTNYTLIRNPIYNDELSIKQIIHGDSSGYYNPGLHRTNVAVTPFSFYLTGTVDGSNLAENQAMVALLKTAVVQFENTTGLVPIPGQPTMSCPISIDPNLSSNGQTQIGISNGIITSCKILMHGLSSMITPTVSHELGHAYGLDHHNGVGMLGKSWDGNNEVYSPLEIEAFGILRAMTPASNYVYDDRAVYGTSKTSSTTIVVFNCGDHR